MSYSPPQLDAQIERASQPDFQSLEIVYQSSPSWPYNPNSQTPVHISILDSSFNPPTRAHHAISAASFPSLNANSSRMLTEGPGEYTARLLLFSARNVDKKLKEHEPSIKERVEMMILQAKAMEEEQRCGSGGIAVGLINEPTFAGKSVITKSHFARQSTKSHTPHNPPTKITLTFLIGTDTLIRFFDPRYYKIDMQETLRKYFSDREEDHGDGSYLVSARRGVDETDRGIENEVLKREEVKGWVEMGKVRLLGSGNEGWEEISSTRIRDNVKALNADSTEGDMAKALKNLCIPDISKYIHRKGLYK